MSAVREWAASQGSKLSEAVAVNNLGKWKTATQMTALTILLVIRDNSFTEVGLLGATGVGFLYVSAGLAVWSLVVYMKKIWKYMCSVTQLSQEYPLSHAEQQGHDWS
nr:CDP-diacylglycerol--glycerol-3-phosphate 3-phosphatidyltransferase 2-like [Tanacetum cinerariifolium]